MSDENKLREIKQRGDQAKHLLENPLLNKAFETVSNSLMQKLKETPSGDEDAILDLHKCVQMLELVQECLKLTMIKGINAEKEINQLIKEHRNAS